MSTTFSVRIPRDLKERMKGVKAEWSEEVRNFIQQRTKHLEMIETLEKMKIRGEERRVNVDSTLLIREDRER